AVLIILVITTVLGSWGGGLLVAPLQVGLYMMAYRRILGLHVDLGNLFDGFRRFGWTVLAMLLISLGLGVLAVPGALLFFFGIWFSAAFRSPGLALLAAIGGGILKLLSAFVVPRV